MLRGVLCLLVLAAPACLPRVPKQRLVNTTPIAVGYIVDPTYAGQATTAPDKLKEELRRVLEERNLSVVEVPFERLADERITDTRKAALKAAAPVAQYHLLVELRVHFFSQLDGRYRWEVGSTLSASNAGGAESKDAFEVPVILVYDHEKQRAAMNSAAPDIATHLATLIDGLLVSRKKASDSAAPPSFQQPLAPGQLVPPRSKPAEEKPVETTTPPKASRTPHNIYFAMVDRFANGDRSNDGDANPQDPQAFHGGDMLGLRQRLDWLQAMGVDTLWLSPVFAMRTKPWHGYGAFHGYWTYDLNAIEPRLGTEAQLTSLADELHRRGMQLILDMVLNHVGPEAPLVTQWPEWFHGKGGITNWNDPVQLTTFDVHGLPDLATERDDVSDWLVSAGRRWLPARSS